MMALQPSVTSRSAWALAGGHHADAVALSEAGELAFGSTVYVTLEPCNHFGRTPPRVEALHGAGVERVVFGCRDFNHVVAGGGAERLRSLGVEVVESSLGPPRNA